MQKYACVSFKLFIIPFLFFLLFLPHFTIMKHNWLHSVMNEKSLWCWSSQQTKISWSLIFRKRIFMMSCLRFLCTFNPFSFARRRSERKFSEKNKIIFYDDNNDIDINLWASFSLQNENFLMFADWSAYIRKKKANEQGYWGQKTLAWLWKSQLEDKWRTDGWRCGGFHCNSCFFSPPLSLSAITCWCEKNTTFPFLLHILTTNCNLPKALKLFAAAAACSFFPYLHKYTCISTSLLRLFLTTNSLDSNNWAQLTLNF